MGFWAATSLFLTEVDIHSCGGRYPGFLFQNGIPMEVDIAGFGGRKPHFGAKSGAILVVHDMWGFGRRQAFL